MLRDRLKKLLRAKGITNYRLSKELDIYQSQLSRFFNGKGGISLENLQRIADHLGCEITLVTEEEAKKERDRKKWAEAGQVAEAKEEAEKEIERIVEEFEDKCQVYVRSIDVGRGKVRLYYEKGVIG